MPAIASVEIGALHGLAGDPGDLDELILHHVALMRQTGPELGTGHVLAAAGAGMAGGKAHLAPVLVADPDFTLADAVNLRPTQARISVRQGMYRGANSENLVHLLAALAAGPHSAVRRFRLLPE